MRRSAPRFTGQKRSACGSGALVAHGSTNSEIRVLSVGVDTLYWSSRFLVGPWFDDLRDARTRATEGGDAVAWRTLDGFALEVLPHGAFRYPVVLDCSEFRLHITDSTR